MTPDCYCIWLRKASRRVTATYDAALAPAGVNIAQFSLLRNIARHAPVSLTEIGRRLELERSTVGRNVKVLERMGLVTTVSGEDQREANLVLTSTGRATLERSVPLWEEAQVKIDAALGGRSDELQALLRAL